MPQGSGEAMERHVAERTVEGDDEHVCYSRNNLGSVLNSSNGHNANARAKCGVNGRRRPRPRPIAAGGALAAALTFGVALASAIRGTAAGTGNPPPPPHRPNTGNVNYDGNNTRDRSNWAGWTPPPPPPPPPLPSRDSVPPGSGSEASSSWGGELGNVDKSSAIGASSLEGTAGIGARTTPQQRRGMVSSGEGRSQAGELSGFDQEQQQQHRPGMVGMGGQGINAEQDASRGNAAAQQYTQSQQGNGNSRVDRVYNPLQQQQQQAQGPSTSYRAKQAMAQNQPPPAWQSDPATAGQPPGGAANPDTHFYSSTLSYNNGGGLPHQQHQQKDGERYDGRSGMGMMGVAGDGRLAGEATVPSHANAGAITPEVIRERERRVVAGGSGSAMASALFAYVSTDGQ